MKNILVTGGSGYIGAHTCKYIKSQGLNPIVFDNFVHGHKYAVKWGEYVEGDLSNTALVESTIKKYKIDGVIHFAAFAYVGESVQNPIKYYENNVMGTLSLLKAMLNSDVKKIVFSSTCATYGIPTSTPIVESALQNPINPYGQSKLIVENILKDYGSSYGLHSVALRYFNASGASFDGDIGEDHTPETHAIPLALQSALSGTEFKIFGNDYSTPDGTCIRDYIHVIDLASAHFLALQSMNNNKNFFRAYNLGTGKGTSVNELINTINAFCKPKCVRTSFAKRRDGDPPILIADSNLAKKELGWIPVHSDIKTIVETAFKWEAKKTK